MSEKFEIDIIRRDFLGFVKTHYVSAEIFIKILEEANNKEPLPHKQLVHDKWLSTYTDMKYIDHVKAIEFIPSFFKYYELFQALRAFSDQSKLFQI